MTKVDGTKRRIKAGVESWPPNSCSWEKEQNHPQHKTSEDHANREIQLQKHPERQLWSGVIDFWVQDKYSSFVNVKITYLNILYNICYFKHLLPCQVLDKSSYRRDEAWLPDGLLVARMKKKLKHMGNGHGDDPTAAPLLSKAAF